MHRVAIAQAAPTAVDNSFGDKEAVLKLAAEFAAEDIQIIYQLGDKVRSELRSGLDMRSAFEMLLLRMMVFSPSLVDQNLMPSQAESDDVEQHSDQLRDEQSETPVDRPLMETAGGQAVSEPADNAQSQKKNTLADRHESELRARQHEFDPKSVCDESQSPAESLQEPTQSEVRRSGSLRTLTHESWMDIFPSLSVSGIVRSILANTQWEEFSEGILVLRLAEDQSALYTEEILPKLESALTQYFCERVRLKITVGVIDQKLLRSRRSD